MQHILTLTAAPPVMLLPLASAAETRSQLRLVVAAALEAAIVAAIVAAAAFPPQADTVEVVPDAR